MKYYNSITIIVITVGGTLAITGSRTLSRSRFVDFTPIIGLVILEEYNTIQIIQ